MARTVSGVMTQAEFIEAAKLVYDKLVDGDTIGMRFETAVNHVANVTGHKFEGRPSTSANELRAKIRVGL